MRHMLCIGFGYSARALAREIDPVAWRITGTSRSADGCVQIERQGHASAMFDGGVSGDAFLAGLGDVSHLLVSAAPGPAGDPVLNALGGGLARLSQLEWIGYLSTVGVYGDHDGAWVDEESPLRPVSARSVQRAEAERAWLDFAASSGKPVEIFRLSGIYGPGRGPFQKLRNGTSRRIIKPGQVFNRIHADDIAGALAVAVNRPARTAVYNLTDDLPAPPQDVIAHAAELLGIEPPPEVAFEDADLTPMGRSFYGENKRVRNDRIKAALGYTFRRPTYREGLAAILAAEGQAPSGGYEPGRSPTE